MIRDLPPLAVLDGQFVNVARQQEAIAAVGARLAAGRGFTLFTLNLDHMVKRRSDLAFAAAYARATFVTADGAPVAALARRQGRKMARVTGADLVAPVCAEAERLAAPIFLFGASEACLSGAVERLRTAFPDLDLRGCEAPPQGFDPSSEAAAEAGARIAASGAQLCFVALGAPKQEIFSDRMAARYPQIGFVCVGASLDFLAGSQKRAPQALRTFGLEWAWRLANDPRRLAGRYARCFRLLAELVIFGVDRRPLALPRRT
jgi:N-acetylglucosaminyldiphosphoundecaprenol N-acetyl-beta-D-mannosaminyltransferase